MGDSSTKATIDTMVYILNLFISSENELNKQNFKTPKLPSLLRKTNIVYILKQGKNPDTEQLSSNRTSKHYELKTDWMLFSQADFRYSELTTHIAAENSNSTHRPIIDIGLSV